MGKHYTRTDLATDPTLVSVGSTVYDLAKFQHDHPGGAMFASLFGGRDATNMYASYHRREWPAEKMEAYKLGELDDTPLTQDQLHLELSKKVNAVLPNRGFAPWWYFVKAVLLLAAAVYVEYSQLIGGRTLLRSLIQGVIFAWIGLNIQHDANHGSLSRHGWVNRIFGLTQDWIGGSSILWLQQHVVLHHVFTNDTIDDPDINAAPLLRLHPQNPFKSWYKLQHIYMLPLEFLYGMVPIFLHAVDLAKSQFAGTQICPLAAPYVRTSQVLKAAFLVRFVVLPLYLEPSLQTAGLLFLTTAAGGLYLSFFFALSHNYEGVEFVAKDIPALADKGFVERQCRTSSNVCGPVLAFFNGGLNYQIEHHLFPRVHHSHYSTIAPVVRRFCEERKIRYTHFPTISENLSSMIRHLQHMGTPKKHA